MSAGEGQGVDRKDLVSRAITRISVPPGQITLFKVLFERPDRLSKREIANLIRDGDGGLVKKCVNELRRRPSLRS
jgi:hypothetical protein